GMEIRGVFGGDGLVLRLGQQVRRRQGPADPGTKDGQHDEPACRGNLHRWLLLSPGPVPGISCSAARSGAARTISSLEVTIGESGPATDDRGGGQSEFAVRIDSGCSTLRAPGAAPEKC